MPDSTSNLLRRSAWTLLVLLVPLVSLVGGYAFVNHLQGGIRADYDRYREFWGGNPSEVFSHWLDMLLMSGGAAVMAWLTGVEAFLRRIGSSQKLIKPCLVSLLVLSGVVATVLDGSHGEGTVLIAYPLFFLPILATSFYLLRRLAALCGWHPAKVIPLGIAFATVHLAAQLQYEPSGTGAPNGLIIPFWLACVGNALLWSFVCGIRTGFLKRTASRTFNIVRRPTVWGGSIAIGLAIGIPLTLHAQRTQRIHQQMAYAWLDDLEAKLTDAFIEEIKRNHIPSKDVRSKIPLSEPAHSLLTDTRIKDANGLRIFVPVSPHGYYLFLWGNGRFQYCDTRQIINQIDQHFIDTLIDRGGTHQTGLLSVLWSPYMAGRVIKNQDGTVKAICVLNVP